MKRSKLLLFLTLASLISTCLCYSDITIKNRRLYVNCEEFIIKAMCYHPVPLGWKNIASDQTGGGGYCSPKRTPFGEWKSACYDSDFYDGSPDVPGREPAGPAEGWFQALWDRDFPILKELGTNTLRLYTTNPTTRQATIEQLGTNGIVEALGKDHIPFMDKCAEYGFKVIFPLIGDFTILDTWAEADVQRLLRNQIDEVGNHSALVMWNFSNELPLDTNPEIVEMLNKYMKYIKEYQAQKWNRYVPVTAAVVDIPSSYDHLMATLDVDIFSTNAGYRGVDFQDLWSGERTEGFSGFSNLTKMYNKPVFIAEIGWHQEDNEFNILIPDWFNQIYKDLIANMDEGTIGGAFFEYNDEPYSKVDILQQTMGVVAFAPSEEGGRTSEEMDMFVPDTIIRKQNIFASVKEGTFQGRPYNFNADPWELMGRAKTTLSAEECVPPPTPVTTTGVSATSSDASTSSNGSTTGSNGSTTSSNQNPTTGNSNLASTTDNSAVLDQESSANTFGLFSVVMATIAMFSLLL